jgi:hypothetical protein
MTVDDLRLQFEKETKENWMVNPVCHGEIGFASWKYQIWLEQKAIQVEAKVKVNFADVDISDKVERARIFMMDVAWAEDKTMTAKDAREIITRVYGKEVMEEVLSRFSG